MTDHAEQIHPTHCFCQIPDQELRPWAEKRYRDHESTLDLMHSTDDPHEKEIISIVALLDVDETTLLKTMGDVEKPDHHIIHCRQHVRQILGLSSSD